MINRPWYLSGSNRSKIVPTLMSYSKKLVELTNFLKPSQSPTVQSTAEKQSDPKRFPNNNHETGENGTATDLHTEPLDFIIILLFHVDSNWRFLILDLKFSCFLLLCEDTWKEDRNRSQIGLNAYSWAACMSFLLWGAQ